MSLIKAIVSWQMFVEFDADDPSVDPLNRRDLAERAALEAKRLQLEGLANVFEVKVGRGRDLTVDLNPILGIDPLRELGIELNGIDLNVRPI